MWHPRAQDQKAEGQQPAGDPGPGVAGAATEGWLSTAHLCTASHPVARWRPGAAGRGCHEWLNPETQRLRPAGGRRERHHHTQVSNRVERTWASRTASARSGPGPDPLCWLGFLCKVRVPGQAPGLGLVHAGSGVRGLAPASSVPRSREVHGKERKKDAPVLDSSTENSVIRFQPRGGRCPFCVAGAGGGPGHCVLAFTSSLCTVL